MDKKTVLVGVLAFGLIGFATLAVWLLKPTVGLRGTVYAEPYPDAPLIRLTRHDGSTFQLGDLKGRIVLLFFGYTTCPDVCPTTLAELKTAIDRVGPENAGQVKVVFVTVDPQRDSPQRVQEYVNHFNKEFIGLSGSEPELAKVWNDYGIYRSVAGGSSAAGYLVDHTARITLIGQDGKLRASYGYETPVDDLVHDLQFLLQ
ncbi:MAG: SCO family protein [Syntrophothermus sp.]